MKIIKLIAALIISFNTAIAYQSPGNKYDLDDQLTEIQSQITKESIKYKANHTAESQNRLYSLLLLEQQLKKMINDRFKAINY